MFVTKVVGDSVRVYDMEGGATSFTIACRDYGGVLSVAVENGELHIYCGDGRLRVFTLPHCRLIRVG